MSDDSPKTSSQRLPERQRVTLVTGLSGAGKTTVLQVLEDLGWETIDNLPVRLVARFLSPHPEQDSPVAIGFDSRTRGFEPEDMLQLIEQLETDPALELKTLFLNCSTDELERRYNETRRRHPLAGDRPVRTAIEAEREWLKPMCERADWVLDTTGFTSNDLQQRVRGHFADDAVMPMQITVSSFGFARGMPPLADLVFDMRFIRNPHWEEKLRPQTGLDKDVGNYIEGDEAFRPALTRITDLLDTVLPRYAEQGRSYLNIGIGCTGGKHRSVYTAECIAEHLLTTGFSPTVIHRNLTASPAKTDGDSESTRVAPED